MAGGELRLGTASMYMADVYHHTTIKSINKYPFTWLHFCGQTKTSRAKSVASCFGMKEDQLDLDGSKFLCPPPPGALCYWPLSDFSLLLSSRISIRRVSHCARVRGVLVFRYCSPSR